MSLPKVFEIVVPVSSLDTGGWCCLKSGNTREVHTAPVAKNLLRWAYALRWVPLQSSHNGGGCRKESRKVLRAPFLPSFSVNNL